MRPRFLVAGAALIAAIPLAYAVSPAGKQRALRVCSDPNNLPFSNRDGEGFENRLAQMLAEDAGARVEYAWWPQRRGFIRNTLRAGSCDVVMGMPMSYELALATRPYYRSTYVFVTRRDQEQDIVSLDDPRLRTLRVGVTVIGDDYANSPPAHALARRGIIDNVRGYSVYGDYAEPNPPARLIGAVASGEVDVAVAWGPMAGYFARASKVPMRITPVSPAIDVPYLPFVFDISLGVRREDTALRDRIDAFLERRRPAIDSLLAEYGVPRVDGPRPVS